MAIREAQRQSLAEKQAYWKAETDAVLAEFGPEVAEKLHQFAVEGRRVW